MSKILVKYLFFLFILLWSGFANIHAHLSKTDIKLKEISVQKSFSAELGINNSPPSTEKSVKLFFEQEEDETESSKKHVSSANYFADVFDHNNSYIFTVLFKSSLAYDQELVNNSINKRYLLFQVFRI